MIATARRSASTSSAIERFDIIRPVTSAVALHRGQRELLSSLHELQNVHVSNHTTKLNKLLLEIGLILIIEINVSSYGWNVAFNS